MNRSPAAWLAVLCINGAWLFLLPSRSDKSVALAGVVTAALILLAPAISSRARDYASLSNRPLPPQLAALLVLPFLLPALSLVAAPNIVFWSLDGRVWLIIAWLSAAIVLSLWHRAERSVHFPNPAKLPLATALFLLWSSALWLTVLSDLGIGAFAFKAIREGGRGCQFDPLTTAFSIWESNPASEHLFLGWRSLESFHKREPYANHVHPYLLTMYAWVRGVRALTGVKPYVASNTIPFFYMFVLLAGVTALLARGGLLRDRDGLRSLLMLFVAYGLILTAWRFWYDLYRFTSDNPYPLLAGVFLFVYAFLLEPMRPVPAAVSASIFVALSPIHAPMAVVAVLFFFNRPGTTVREALSRNRVLIAISIAAFATGVISYVVPRLLIAWKDYAPVASSFFFRSGLDGDTRYFSNMVQSVLAPCPVSCCGGRTLTDLLFPAFVPLAVFGLAAWRSAESDPMRPWHVLMFLCTPYLISLVLFPQSLSIHPYMYDHMLLIPVVVTGVVILLTPSFEEKLTGPRLLAVLLLAGAVIMANLIAIAQGLAAMPV